MYCVYEQNTSGSFFFYLYCKKTICPMLYITCMLDLNNCIFIVSQSYLFIFFNLYMTLNVCQQHGEYKINYVKQHDCSFPCDTYSVKCITPMDLCQLLFLVLIRDGRVCILIMTRLTLIKKIKAFPIALCWKFGLTVLASDSPSSS